MIFFLLLTLFWVEIELHNSYQVPLYYAAKISGIDRSKLELYENCILKIKIN